MANQKISELTALTGANVQPTIDQIPIVDSSVTTTKKITPEQLLIGMGVTATATELNTLDGITASTAELNIMDGVTASTAEINILDGVTASTSEINQLDDNTFDTQVNVPSIVVSGTNGSGHADLRWQASNPTAGGNHTALWADADGDINIKKDGGAVEQLATTADVALKVTANGAITGATKTKITYDTKGLVTAGADATTDDIADSLNKRYVTDAQQTVLSNTSGTNTGDQNIFQTIAVSGQSNVVADGTADTLTFAAGSGMTITTDASTDTITFAASSTSGGPAVYSASLGSIQTNYSISGVSTSKTEWTMLRITPTAGFSLQSINTTSWENGKVLSITNISSQSASGSCYFIIENNNGASGTQFSYANNGVPLMMGPGERATFVFNSTTSKLEFINGTSFSSSNASCFDAFTDCLGGYVTGGNGTTGDFNIIQQSATGSATLSATFATNTTLKPKGVLDLSTLVGTNTIESLGTSGNSANTLMGGYGSAYFLARLSPTTALSNNDATNTYKIYVGFHDTIFGTLTDGVYWEYDQLSYTTWSHCTASNSSVGPPVTNRTQNTSGLTVSITEMPYLGIFMNGDWTNAYFFYSADGVSWTHETPHTTNIPTGTSRLFGAYCTIQKTAGSTARVLSIDLMGLKFWEKRGA